MAKAKVSSFICYGVNSAISIINSNRFNIRYIDIMKNGNAQKNKKLLNVIDDSIVMLENIHKKIESGMSRFEAALAGSKEVFFAIVSTSIGIMSDNDARNKNVGGEIICRVF